MIHDIREAFNDLLEENEWMDTETRHVAEDKANSMTERIGYPEYITNDTRLQEEYQNVSFRGKCKNRDKKFEEGRKKKKKKNEDEKLREKKYPFISS